MSGVYISGMEMPKSCYDCPVECEGDVCGITKGGCTWDERPPHCPLIPVPEHGRLIDADALSKQFVKDETYFTEEVVYEIDNAPTIIPADKDGAE